MNLSDSKKKLALAGVGASFAGTSRRFRHSSVVHAGGNTAHTPVSMPWSVLSLPDLPGTQLPNVPGTLHR